MSSGKINWLKHFIEFVVVTLGILLGFVLNNWNEERKEKIEAKNYLEAIYIEVEDNIKELQDKVPYHEELLATLRTDPLNARMVLNPPSVSNVAWEMAQNNAFKSHIDKDLFRRIAKVYKAHENLTMQMQVASERMAEINILGPFYMMAATNQNPSEKEKEIIRKEEKRSWIPIFESWTATEKYYKRKLEQLSDHIEKVL